VYEIWDFEEKEKYSKETKSGGLFTNYLNAALKKKQEASGYPEQCITDADKKAYIDDYYENEGILLDETNICKNPGMRVVSKLLANTLW
jgi:hypothetical protein